MSCLKSSVWRVLTVRDGRLPHPSLYPARSRIKDFKAADKTALFNQASDEVSLLPHHFPSTKN